MRFLKFSALFVVLASLLTATNAQARFLQTDPVGYKDGPDWYLYVQDDPLNHADPTGLTCADGKGPCSPEQLRQTQQNFKNYVETQVAPTTNKQLAIGGGAIIATGVTAGAAGATIVGAAGAGEVTTVEAVIVTPRSPSVSPSEVAGRTPAEIHDVAVGRGLIPKGPSPTTGRGSYVDPVTGQQRVLIHPEAEPPHAHVNTPSGVRLDINGKPVQPESPAAHLPISN